MDSKEFLETVLQRKLTDTEAALIDAVGMMEGMAQHMAADVPITRVLYWPSLAKAIPLPIRKPTITEWENAALRTMTRRKLVRIRKRWNRMRRNRQRDGAWVARWDQLTDLELWLAADLGQLE